MSLFDLLNNMVEVYTCFWYISSCLVKKLKYSKTNILLFSIITFLLISYSNSIVYYSVAHTIIGFSIFLIFATLFFENGLIEKLTIGLSALFISLIATIITINAFNLMWGIDHFSIEQNSFIYIAVIIFTRIIHISFSWLLIKFRKITISFSIGKRWIWLVIALVSSIVAIILCFDLLVTYSDDEIIMIIILLVVIIFLCIFIGVFTIQKAEKENIDSVIELNELKHQSAIINQYNTNYNEIKTLKHDLKHELSTIRGFLENKDYESALLSLKMYNDEVTSVGFNQYSGNYVIDFVISNKIKLAREKNIDVKSEIAIFDIKINQSDFCLVLGNLFDNAIENCSGKLNINFELRNVDNYLIMIISNTTENNVDTNRSIFKTSKSDKKSHGFGLNSIRRKITKYGGEMKILTTGKNFIVEIIMSNE